jgi:hypothetical protein
VRRSALVVARAAGAVRGLWPDRNPLRRRLDRVEAVMVAGLAVAFLASAPIAAATAWHAAHAAAARTSHAQRSWHQAPAVLLASVPASQNYRYGPLVQVRWAAVDGTRHTGTVYAPGGAKPGSTVMVWVDASGRLTSLPLRPAQVLDQAELAALLAPVVLGVVLACVGLLAHGALALRRTAAWAADWQVTEPEWTRHR